MNLSAASETAKEECLVLVAEQCLQPALACRDGAQQTPPRTTRDRPHGEVAGESIGVAFAGRAPPSVSVNRFLRLHSVPRHHDLFVDEVGLRETRAMSPARRFPYCLVEELDDHPLVILVTLRFSVAGPL